MKRLPDLRIGSRTIELEQPEGLFVVRSRKGAIAPAGQTVGMWQGRRLVTTDAGDVPKEIRETWSAAGWNVVAMGEADAAGPELEHMAPIFRTSEGHWWIGTDRLVVRFRDDLEKAEVDELLERFRLRVERQLRMKPNLFDVRVEGEVMVVAAELQELPQVEYAEPQFLESLGPR